MQKIQDNQTIFGKKNNSGKITLPNIKTSVMLKKKSIQCCTGIKIDKEINGTQQIVQNQTHT